MHPSRVARLVMERTGRVFIVGDGALRFALAHGFKEEDLLTEASREKWLRWKEQMSDIDDWGPPGAGRRAGLRGAAEEVGAQRRATREDLWRSLGIDPEKALGHDQLPGARRERRPVGHHDDQRPGVQDSRPHRRLADDRLRAVRGQRSGRRRIDGRRRRVHQGGRRAHRRRVHAPGHAPARGGARRRSSACSRSTARTSPGT